MSAGDRIAGPQPIGDSAYIPDRRSRTQRVILIAIAAFAAAFVAAASTVFIVGEDLFGSDPDTIDSYNAEVLESCDLPSGSTLVRTYVLQVFDDEGRSYRGLAHVYASTQDAEQIAAFYGLETTGVQDRVSDERACKFSQRPSILVEAVEETAGVPPETPWGEPYAEVTEIVEPPAGTQSFFRLWLAQREAEGVL